MIRHIFKLSACLLTGGLLLAGCGKKQADDVAKKSYEDYKKEAQQEITPEMREELGAALLVEDDVSFFVAGNKPMPRLKGLWQSNAVQNLLQLPTLQQGLMFAKASPQYAEFMNEVLQHPMYKTGKPVADDALGKQVFICADSSLPAFVKSINTLKNTQNVVSFLEGMDSAELPAGYQEKLLMEAFKAEKANLSIPGILIGMQLSSTANAEKLIRKTLEYLPDEMLEYTGTETVQGAEFQTLLLKGGDIPKAFMQELRGEVEDPATGEVLEDWLAKQQAMVAVGILNSHLLISIGSDLAFVESFGPGREETSLAASGSFRPFRKRFKQGLRDIAYVSAPMMTAVSWKRDVEDYPDLIEKVLTVIPDDQMDADLKTRIRADVTAFCDEVISYDESAPSAPVLQFSFDNQGVEKFAIYRGLGVAPEKLSILKYRGRNPLMYCASNSPEYADLYDMTVKWLKVAYGYTEEIMVLEMSENDLEEYKSWEAVMMPFLQKVDTINRANMIPAIDGVQSMLVADAEGALKNSEIQANDSNAVSLIRTGMVIELNDAESFRNAMRGYYAATEKLVSQIKENDLIGEEFTAFSLPEIQQTGELYHYDLPWQLGDDLFPCARFDGNTLLLCSSKKMSKELLEKVAMPADGVVVDLDQSAAAAMEIELDRVWEYLLALNKDLVAETSARQDLGTGSRYVVGLARYHLDTVYKSLKALRKFRKSTTVDDDGFTVEHSWLEVKDID
ncbi:MAG: hypothetical protein R6V56_09060 [Lentisphaeria bacterium]